MWNVQRHHTTIERWVHVVFRQLDQSRDLAIIERSKCFQYADEPSNEFSMANARLGCTNDQRRISGVRGLEDLTDPLNLDKIAQRGACRFSRTRLTSGSQDELTSTMRLQKTGNHK